MPSTCGRMSIQTTKYWKKKAPGDLIFQTCRINEALPGFWGNKGHLCQVNKGTKV